MTDSMLNVASLSKLLNESREAQTVKSGEQFSQKPAPTASTMVRRHFTGSSDAIEPIKIPIPVMKSLNDIWADDEVPSEDALLNIRDDRPCPRYEISYKQVIGTADTFLGFSDKTPLSSDCTHIVIKVHFPGSTMKELDLDVSQNRLMAASKTHYLFTYLPADVDNSNGNAVFDSKKDVLTVTLPVIPREF
jgi:hypothetical protein